MVRWLPFLVAALFSLAMASRAPNGRRPFQFDWEISAAALSFSLAKADHIAACAALAFLALLAAGRARWGVAMTLTLIVGFGWELAQASIVGRGPRLADLAPDAVGAALGCVLAAVSLWTIEVLPNPVPRPR
jgi:VanZ family protein